MVFVPSVRPGTLQNITYSVETQYLLRTRLYKTLESVFTVEVSDRCLREFRMDRILVGTTETRSDPDQSGPKLL